MAYVHEFGIVDCILEYKENEYEPEKYNCITIDGEFIDEIYHKGFGNKMKHLDTFAHNINRPFKDLAYYGTTLIPPSSLHQFLSILTEENMIYNSDKLEKLIDIILTSIKEDKWLIHYGV